MLDVLFEEKDEAKRRGARWDSAARSWYAPPGADLGRFREWLPPVLPGGPRCKVRVLALRQTCWKCRTETHAIVALMVDAHDLPRPSSDPGLVWFSDVAEALSVVLKPGALRHIGAGPLRRRLSRSAGTAYVSNGCRECDALLGNVPLRVAMATYMNGGGDLEALAVGRVSIPAASLPDEWEPLWDDSEEAAAAVPAGPTVEEFAAAADEDDTAGITIRPLSLAEALQLVDGHEPASPYRTPDAGAVLIPVEGPIVVREERLTHEVYDEFIGGSADAIYLVNSATGRQAATAYVHGNGYALRLPLNPRASALLRGRSGYEKVVGPVLITGLPGDVVGENPCPGWLVRLALDLDAQEGR
ncbi:MAG TPA: DUF5710 domain-containing protein [Candidatus Dormibacteraeota bacterium]|nr:DUF5710 domain-containing protein [Candidatus Dormibacteraeota bacterium]